MNRLKRIITVGKEVRFGQPVFKGTRIPVYHLFEYLWAGYPISKFSEDFPSVSTKQVQATIAIAEKFFTSKKLASLYENFIGRKQTSRAKGMPTKITT